MDSGRSHLIATHSGLRGRPGAELSDAVVAATVTRHLELLRRRGLPASLGVARDDRPEGAALAGVVMDAAVAGGATVLDFGAVATPAAKLGARARGLGGAVIVTGSHLGPEWNGLKLVAGPDYLPVDVRTLPDAMAAAGARGSVERCDDVAAEHVEAIVASVDAESVRTAGLAVDVSGGVGSAGSLLLDRLGCRQGAARPDLALEMDADADRLELIDEHGVALGADATLPLVALARDARKVVKGADTSRMVDVVVEAAGGEVHAVAPGELHLLEGLAAVGGDLAGEGNGGVVVPNVVMARDALAAAAQVLALLARAPQPLSAIAARLPRLEVVRSVVPCEDADAARRAIEGLALVRGSAAAAADPHTGVRFEGELGAWGLVRLSATEPVLRITAEAGAADAALALHAELRAGLGVAEPVP